MNGTEFRIIDALSRRIGDPVSIRELTSEIKKQVGSAYYPNIYRALMSLKDENIVKIRREGKAAIPSLNFEDYLLSDVLTELELRKKLEFLRLRPGARSMLESLERAASGLPFVDSVVLVDPTHNAKLGRAEVLVIVDERSEAEEERTDVMVREIMEHHNTRLEHLVVSKGELIDALRSQETNPIRDMLSDQMALYMPQKLWTLIRDAYLRGVRIRIGSGLTDPAKISEEDLAYNLAKLGYKELGPEAGHGVDVSVEYVVASILLGGDKRRAAAVPVVLAKNKANYGLLAFLSQKYGFAEALLGALVALSRVAPSRELDHAVSALGAAGVDPTKMDDSHIKETMRLYGVGAR